MAWQSVNVGGYRTMAKCPRCGMLCIVEFCVHCGANPPPGPGVSTVYVELPPACSIPAGPAFPARWENAREQPPEPLADVVLSCGRWWLRVVGVFVAMETDLCRDPAWADRYWDRASLEQAAGRINAAAHGRQLELQP